MSDKKQLGCLSPLAIGTVLITMLIMGIISFTNGFSMFSPGELHNEHIAEIGNDCAKCHAPFWGKEGMTERCLFCHTDVNTQINDPSSLHGAMTNGQNFTCRSCHNDHKGRNADLTQMDLSAFSHELFGFSLVKHTKDDMGKVMGCVDCHDKGYSDQDPNTCFECHKRLDGTFMMEHLDSFGSDCLACHDGIDRFGEFDHDRTGLPLSGEHSKLKCTECHGNARSLSDLETKNGSCGSCHLDIDPHRGEFGGECELCHNTTAWEPANFDHNKFSFALTGAHTQVECESCHASGYMGTPTECFACHQKDDPHEGAFGRQCEGCHDTIDWENAVFDHSKSDFPLNGAHFALDCEKCHSNNIFAGTPTECAACHSEPLYHSNLFLGQNCDTCHSDFTWRPAKFDQPHTFPINHGAERGKSNTCDSCHQPTLNSWTCYVCHNQAEIVSEHREEGITDFTNCIECHPTGEEGDDRGGDD